MNLKQELTDWLDKQTITGDNIGDIRRDCFMPWDSRWNEIVREETAARELRQDDLDMAHELGACGGDCPQCQQERAEQRDDQA